jgi:hypothetical protein
MRGMPVPAELPVRGIPLEAPTVGNGFEIARVTEPTGSTTDETMVVESMKLVSANDWPPTCTVPPGIKPEPVIVIEVGFPARKLDGVTEATMGDGFCIGRGKILETPAEGEGF